jgi:N-acetylglucosamine-6-sulfatase
MRLTAAVLVLAGPLVAIAGAGLAADTAAPPGIVLILTDDEDLEAHQVMPKTKALIEDEGVVFDNAFVSYPFCAPSRATILRGQYPHNHRVEGNESPAGGYWKLRALGHEQSTIATWLQAAGWHTALLGKYVNGYAPDKDGVPPGWSDWHVAGDAYAGYNYTLNENGELVAYGAAPEDYLTDVLARKAVEIIHRAAAARQPLFLYVAPFRPHSPATPAPRHEHLFADAPLPRPEAFDEADVSDKPSLVRKLPLLAAWQIEALTAHHRDRLRSMQAIDDMVEDIVRALDEVGRLDATYLVYFSDNGFHLGLHRLFIGKDTAYEPDIHVPLAIRGPGVPKGEHRRQIVLNNDLAPTLAAIAGIAPPAFVDGRSLLPLLGEAALPWRQGFLITRRETETQELAGAAAYEAIRTNDYTYVEYGNGELELYDHRKDPQQLDNAIRAADPALVAALSARLAELANCASVDCPAIEDRPIAPQGLATLPGQ